MADGNAKNAASTISMECRSEKKINFFILTLQFFKCFNFTSPLNENFNEKIPHDALARGVALLTIVFLLFDRYEEKNVNEASYLDVHGSSAMSRESMKCDMMHGIKVKP